ncbi:YafY family transcriptional regulator [Pseudomonas aeruginosa]|nr:YafY family transcriptional regulator [Pseudomonas aeruginosa]
MSRPTVRVLALLELLQSHGQLSGSELPRRLEVDGRTLRRYIVALEELGIPIASERGRHGGYRLVAGFKLPPLMFSAEETLAVSLGLLAVRGLGLGESELALESAQAKLRRVMPDALRRRLGALSETASLDIARSRGVASVSALATLAEAAQTRSRVEFRYQGPQAGATFRQLDPYGLAYRNGCWYVSGFCHLRQELRSFRLDRLDRLRLLAERFERPADFDTLRHLRESLARVPRAYPLEIILRADPERVITAFGEPLGLLSEEEDGATLLRARTDDLDWFARRLCGLPFGFEIRQPVELREALRRHLERLLQELAGAASDHR